MAAASGRVALAFLLALVLGVFSAPSLRAATSSVKPSPRELDTAVGLFQRFNPALLEPNESLGLDGRFVAPAFGPLRFSREYSLSDLNTKLKGSLVKGYSTGEAGFSLYSSSWENGTGLELRPNYGVDVRDVYDTERLLHNIALVAAHVHDHIDALIRPLPLGFSIYLQFRSAAAAESVDLEASSSCGPPESTEMVRKLGTGTFAQEGLYGESEARCRPYSSAATRATAPPATATGENYRTELSMLKAAKRSARHEHAVVIGVLRAYQARDAAGTPIPTELAWRYSEEPVLSVDLKGRKIHYPVLARIDFIVKPSPSEWKR